MLQSLVTRIERMGISNLMGTPGAISLSAGMYARPALTSPMAQLTCLLPSHSTDNLAQGEDRKSSIFSLAESPLNGICCVFYIDLLSFKTTEFLIDIFKLK